MPLVFVENETATLIKGDKKSLGYKKAELKYDFTNHTLPIRSNISFYLFSDGFADQLGEEDDRKFGNKHFINLLTETAHISFEKQKDVLLETFYAHKGENQMQDDVTVLGFGFKK